MMIPEDPPGFVVRTEAQKAAFDNGYRLELGAHSGWLRYGSTTVPGDIWIAGAAASGPWFLSLGHHDAAAEIGLASSSQLVGPGAETFVFNNLHDLYITLDRTYRLSISLPDAPLRRFRAKTQHLPRTTEAEYLVFQRVGQELFRQALLDYWNRRCPLTGVADLALLRASHIVPWAECETDALRLDVHNGLLLSALWDAAFDAGLVGFADDGAVLTAPTLSPAASATLGIPLLTPLVGLTGAHRVNLARHRVKHGY
jgi:hypothetical protein